jgi:dipeptidyl-peptidase-3
LQQKTLAYYLSQAALAGRDIIWDQHYKHNLVIRRTLEAIYKNYPDQTSDEFLKFNTYLKRVWFSNGIHHHYSNDKFQPEFSQAFFKDALFAIPPQDLPLLAGENLDEFHKRIATIIFDPSVAPKKVSQDRSSDLITHSAINFYENLNQQQVEEYYRSLESPDESRPLSHGLNTKLVFEDGEIKAKPYRLNGLYHSAIEQIIYWLRKAADAAETPLQQQSLLSLIEYYETGNLAKFDEYNILWVQDTEPVVDAINGFIEVYNDPMNKTGSFESVVSIKDLDATAKFGVLAQEAAWFEANSPIRDEHKREKVSGISYKIINVVTESGDSSPSTPVGINLPNANWIREQHGSKSVSLGNIEEAYDESSKTSGFLEEFYLPEVRELRIEHGALGNKLHTGLHEVIGHASGRLEDGIGSIADTLQNYGSPIEEARADLVALYFIGNQHLVDLELIPSILVRNAEYISYLTNGLLTQMARIEPGKNVEEAHMRNRQMISKWVLEAGASEKVVELKTIDSPEGEKTFVVINDYDRLNELFGVLLKEIQRIKSQGDFRAAQNLIENYGVQLDPALHEQVLARYKKLAIAPYAGFINPHLVAEFGKSGEITNVVVNYPNNFSEQMLGYAEEFSFLPNYND